MRALHSEDFRFNAWHFQLTMISDHGYWARPRPEIPEGQSRQYNTGLGALSCVMCSKPFQNGAEECLRIVYARTDRSPKAPFVFFAFAL